MAENLTDEEKLRQARAFVEAVRKLALKRKLNYFVVTDGASGISNNGNPAVRNAREAQIKWELEHGADPYEDWSKQAQAVDHAKWPDFWKWQEEHNDDIVWRVRKAVADNLRSRGKWGLLTSDGRIISEDDLNKGQEIPPEVVIRAARAAREARRANCHELADALLRKLQRMRVGAKRVYVDKDRYNGISMGHSTVFFKDKDGRWHRATSGMGRKKNPPFGDFDSLTDAVDQYIAVEKANKQTTDDERVEAFDTTGIPFKNRMPWKDYRAAAMGGERLYTQKAAEFEKDAGPIRFIAKAVVPKARRVLGAAGRTLSRPLRSVQDRALVKAIFPGSYQNAKGVRRLDPEFIKFLENRRNLGRQIDGGNLAATRFAMSPSTAKRISSQTGVPAKEIYRSYRLGTPDDITKMYQRIIDAGNGNVNAPYLPTRVVSGPQRGRRLIDDIILPPSKRGFALDNWSVVDTIGYQLDKLGIPRTAENIMALGPRLNGRMPISGVLDYKNTIANKGISLQDAIKQLRKAGVEDAVWHGDGMGDPSRMASFDRTWWSGNSGIGLGYALSPTGNLANKGISTNGAFLSALPLQNGTALRNQAYERFTPHVVDSMTPEGKQLAKQILNGEHPSTWNLTTTAATRAPNYETILDRSVFSPHAKDVRTWQVFPQRDGSKMSQADIPVLSGVQDFPAGVRLSNGLPVESLKLVPVEEMRGLRTDHVPFLSNKPSHYSSTTWLPEMMRKQGSSLFGLVAPAARRVMPAMSGVASRVGRIFGRSTKLRPNELVPKDVSNITSRFWNDIVFPMKKRQGTLAKRPNLSDVVIERLPAGRNPSGAVSGRYNHTRDKLFLSSPLPGRSAGNSEFLSGLDTMNHELGHRFTDVLPTPSSTRPQSLIAPQNINLVGDAMLGNFVGEGVPTYELAATVKELQGRLYADYVSRFNRYPSRRKFMSYLDSLPESRFIDEYGKLNSGYTRPLGESVRLGNELSSLEAKRRQAAELLHSVPQEYVGDVERLLDRIYKRQDAVRAAWYPENMAFTNAGLAKRLVRNMWGFGAAALPSAGMAIGASENGANGMQKRGAAFGHLIAPAARRIAGAFGSAMKNTVRGAKIVGGTARNAWRNGVVDTAKGVWRNGVMGPDGIIGRHRMQNIRPDERVRHFFDDIVIPMKMSSRLNGGAEAYAIKNSPARGLSSMDPVSYYHRGFYDAIPIEQWPSLGKDTSGYVTFGPTVRVSASPSDSKRSTLVHELKHVLHKDTDMLETLGRRMGSSHRERDLLRKVYGIDSETMRHSDPAALGPRLEREAFAESAATHAEHQFMVMQELWNKLKRPPTLQEYQDFINKASFNQLRRWRNTVVNGYQSVADIALPMREMPVVRNNRIGAFSRMLLRLGFTKPRYSKKALQRYKTALKWVGSGAAMASPLYGTQSQNDGTQSVL